MPFTLRDLGLVTQVVSSPVFFSANSLIKKRPGSDSMIAEILKPWQTAHGDTGHTVLCVDGETEAPSTLPKVIIAITLWGDRPPHGSDPQTCSRPLFLFPPKPGGAAGGPDSGGERTADTLGLGKGRDRPYPPRSSSAARAFLWNWNPSPGLDFSQTPATTVGLDASHDCSRGHRFPPRPRPLRYLTNRHPEPRNSTPSEGWRGLASPGAHLLICLCSTFSAAGSPLGPTTGREFSCRKAARGCGNLRHRL